MSSNLNEQELPPEDEEDSFLEADEADEVISDDSDHPMGKDDEDEDELTTLEEIQLQNDSSAHFDGHKDSIFTIAQHPIHPEIVATGGGDDVGYIFNSTPPPGPLLPTSYETNPQPSGEREGLKAILKLEGHTDSVNVVAFTLPNGEYVVTAGLDGRLRAWKDTSRDGSGTDWKFLAETLEVQEINWLAPCPDPARPNVVALGANDGSVWIYTIDAGNTETPLEIVQAFYLHTESCTAGVWTPDGKLLATVSEDGSFYVYDAFGEAAAARVSGAEGSAQSLVGLTPADQRFAVEGGLYTVAVSPTGAFAAVGGAGGNIRIVGLPRVGVDPSATGGAKGAGAKNKSGGAKKAVGPVASAGGAGQAGQILASLQAQSDGVETLSFASEPLTYLAAGSVDGTIALFDYAHRFAVRRHIKEAHDEYSVVKVDFVPGSSILTSAGMDGTIRQWETRGGTTASGQGFHREWKGHRGDGEGGGVLGFVQGNGSRVVTAGDDSVSLVFTT